MRITFPHMGETYIAAKGFLEDLGLEVVVPPPCDKETLNIGTRYSPAEICLPFKINIGNYIQSIENGADTILITGSCGPCRFGLFWMVQQEILNNLGYDVEIIAFDPPRENMRAFWQKSKKLLGYHTPYQIAKAAKNAYRIVREMEAISNRLYKIRPREIEVGSADRHYKNFEEKIYHVRGSKAIFELIDTFNNDLDHVDVDLTVKPIKIGIVGEIYTMIEPFINLNLERKLGQLGVEVHRSMTLGNWVETTVMEKLFKRNKEKRIQEAAEPYLKTFIGGHGQECIGYTVQYAEKSYDGVIHLYPFTCMPQIVAKSILPTVIKEYDIPLLTLVVDEMTSEVNYQTRLEAFTDLLKMKDTKMRIG